MVKLITLLLVLLNCFNSGALYAQQKQLLQNNTVGGIDLVVFIDTIDLSSCPEETVVFLEVCNQGDQLVQTTVPITVYHNDPRFLSQNPRFLTITDYAVSLTPGACSKLPVLTVPLLGLTTNSIPNDGNLYFVVNDNTRNLSTGNSRTTPLTFPNASTVEANYSNNVNGPTPINDCNRGALPIELGRFKLDVEKRTVRLNWTTLSELNNSHFIIQRSQDGIKFTNIGEVAGNGTTKITNYYDFWDVQPQKGMNYYRLKQVDYDGSYTYSNVITGSLGALDLALQVYPNPAKGNLTLELANSNIEKAQLRLINELGQVVKTQTINSALARIEFKVEDLPRGVYHLLFINEQGLSITRSVVLN